MVTATVAAKTPAARDESPAAFERRCIPRGLRCSPVAARHAPSSRLAARRPRRSPCCAAFRAGLLARVVGRSVLVLVLAGLPASTAAQDIEVRAYLDRSEVAVDRQFTLNVEVSGTGGADEDPRLPDLSGFAAYLGVGTQTSMQFVAGRTSTSLTYQYRFRAVAEGTHAIGPVRVRAGGEDHATDALTIRVTPAGTAPGRRAPDRSRGGVDIGPEDLFVEASVSTREPWVNEPVLVEYRLFTRVDVESYGITRAPGTTGFWVEEIALPRAPRVEQVVRGGVQYATTVVRRAALFPTGAGPRTIEPLALEARVRVRSGRRFSDPFGFGDPFGGGLFGRSVAVPVESGAIDIEARPLPGAGRPDAFTGLVGSLEASASLDTAAAATNEALTFRLEVRGAGNLRMLADPEVAFPPDFDVYPPEVSDDVAAGAGGVSGARSYEYVLVPRAPGSHVIPAVELAYFDAAAGRYAVAASDPLSVEVTGDVVSGGGPVRLGGGRARGEAARQDIRFIRVATSAFVPTDRRLFRSGVFWTVLLIPLFALAGALALRRHRERLEGNVAYARRRRASRLARSRLAHARGLRAPERHQPFVAGISQALLGFLGDSLNVAEAGLVRDDIRRELGARGVAGDVVERYLACLDKCDQRRFAPPATGDDDGGETAALLEEAELAMTALAEALRS